MRLAFLKEQITWVDNWTASLISDISENEFGIIENLDTSVNWQLGHIIVAKYFHAVQSVVNEESEALIEIRDKLPFNDLFKYYFAGSNPLADWKERPRKNRLVEYKADVDSAVDRIMELLTENALLDKTELENPVARTKYDALAFTFKHQMWHNGQIAMMKRLI